jgi:dTDP-4-amino-4,6-dideoxygalactose transaminase
MLGTNARITEWQAAVLREQLRRLPGQHRRRAARIEGFEKRIAAVPGLRPLARDERVTTRTAYQFILRYDSTCFDGVSRDDVLLALGAEGVPCYGRFYVPIPEDPLFAMDPNTNPLARVGADYSSSAFPVASRAAYQESIWLPHFLFLGGEEEVDDLVAAFAKVQAGAASLRQSGRGGEARERRSRSEP